MAGTKHTATTPGPWIRQTIDDDGAVSIVGADLGGLVGAALPWPTEIDSQDFSRVEANAHLIAAAPSMADAIKGLIGLCQLLRNRDDCPSEIRQALTYNHRIIAGYEALSAAGIDGFQPSDFDRTKAESSHA